MSRATLYCGDVRDVRATLPDESVQCVVTSPPYWGLRDYGTTAQLGLERTPEEYVANMVAVFRDVWRVLRHDGTLWLNMGDSYVSSPRGNAPGDLSTSSLTNPQRQDRIARPRGATSQRNGRSNADEQLSPNRGSVPGLKPKDLVGIPWRVALALQAGGWYLRSDIIWAKRNCMPESVTDRPTKSHEYVFLLSKSESYYFDAEAIREEDVGADHPRNVLHQPEPSGGLLPAHRGIRKTEGRNGAGRNARSVWFIATQPYAGAHSATFPEELARRCILAGSAAKACETCGAPWERVTEGESKQEQAKWSGAGRQNGCPAGGGHDGRTGQWSRTSETVGWQPTCACPTNTGAASSVVLDPFGGSGTTAAVAVGHGRRAIHIDLNPAYLELARQRIGPMFCDDATEAVA